jgi:hypothetical protein
MITLFVLPFALLVVLNSSTSGDRHFCVIFALCRPPPHQDLRRAEAAGSRFARDDKELGPRLGEIIAETQHTGPQPSRHVPRKGAAPLSSAGEKTALHYRLCAL